MTVALLAAPVLVRAAGEQPTKEAPATRLGDDACLECHAQRASAWHTLRHAKYLSDQRVPETLRGCEGCHGPGSKHLEDPNFRSIRNPIRDTGMKAAEPCLVCHQTDIKPSHWMQTSHARAGLGCSACHEVHQDTGTSSLLRKPANQLCLSCHPQQTAEFKLNSHHPLLEGRVNCVDCHDPHQEGPGSNPILKNGDDRCLRCHMEKRGPFVFEHQTSMGANDEHCLTCHRPHGSANPKLTELYGRGLCLQCHTEIAADPAHAPRTQLCWTSGCHNRVHGSNNDRLFIN